MIGRFDLSPLPNQRPKTKDQQPKAKDQQPKTKDQSPIPLLVLSPRPLPRQLCGIVVKDIQHILLAANLLFLANDLWHWWELRRYLRALPRD